MNQMLVQSNFTNTNPSRQKTMMYQCHYLAAWLSTMTNYEMRFTPCFNRENKIQFMERMENSR